MNKISNIKNAFKNADAVVVSTEWEDMQILTGLKHQKCVHIMGI